MSKIVGKTADGEEVSVERDELVSAFLGGQYYTMGYYFSGERRFDDQVIFEYSSNRAPAVDVVVHGQIREE